MPTICAFSILGYVTVSLILLIIKHFGATNAEIVKSMRKVCQVSSWPMRGRAGHMRYMRYSPCTKTVLACLHGRRSAYGRSTYGALQHCSATSGHTSLASSMPLSNTGSLPFWPVTCFCACECVCGGQVVLSFIVFPKPLSWKYCVGGALVAVALYYMQRVGKKPIEKDTAAKDQPHRAAVVAAAGSS